MNEPVVRRGDIFFVQKSWDQEGNEQHFGRPGVVVSNDKNNFYSGTVEVVFCTTKRKKYLPTHVLIDSTNIKSTVLCEQITTIDKGRLGRYIGTCTPEEMDRISAAIMISLSLDSQYSMPFQPKKIWDQENSNTERRHKFLGGARAENVSTA